VSVLGSMYARAYDRLAARDDEAGSAAFRRRLVADAVGDVLEIGTGTGRCLPHYVAPRHVTAIEPDRHMRAIAHERARDCAAPVVVVDGDATRLAFGDGSFDTVVACWVLCTVPDPSAALAEVRRVLRPGGTLRLCEHVRSDDPRRARWQDRLAPAWRVVARGCRCNQDTAAIVRGAGFVDVVLEAFDHETTSPAIVRPTILGRATSPGADAGPSDPDRRRR
jgi:ubiquinone/menaquinone biosynthesis C-methylase UbiE